MNVSIDTEFTDSEILSLQIYLEFEFQKKKICF